MSLTLEGVLIIYFKYISDWRSLMFLRVASKRLRACHLKNIHIFLTRINILSSLAKFSRILLSWLQHSFHARYLQCTRVMLPIYHTHLAMNDRRYLPSECHEEAQSLSSRANQQLVQVCESQAQVPIPYDYQLYNFNRQVGLISRFK